MRSEAASRHAPRDDASWLHAGLELQTKKDLMISNITSRAACLAELVSNPQSFFNCPDLHGGSGLPEGGFRSGEMDSPSNVEEAIAFGVAGKNADTT